MFTLKIVPVAVCAASCRRGPVQRAARQDQTPHGFGPVNVGERIRGSRETMQVRKTRAVGVDLENRSISAAAAVLRCPIQRVVCNDQPHHRVGPIAPIGETVNDVKASAVGLHLEHCSVTRRARNSTIGRDAVQSAVRTLCQRRGGTSRRAENVQRQKDLRRDRHRRTQRRRQEKCR